MQVQAVAAYIIALDKDFEYQEIRDIIYSRVNIVDQDELVKLLEPHMSSNEMNGARYAVNFVQSLRKGI